MAISEEKKQDIVFSHEVESRPAAKTSASAKRRSRRRTLGALMAREEEKQSTSDAENMSRPDTEASASAKGRARRRTLRAAMAEG